jgi:DNA-directed RNA polymerase specialized sigma24 family protein
MLQEDRAPRIPASPVNALGFASGLCRQAKQTRLRNPQSSSLDQAIRLAQGGDAAASEHIYRLHCRRVYSLCLRMARDPAEAEDLTQEAFLQLFRKIHTFRDESAFSSWLYRLTANMALYELSQEEADDGLGGEYCRNRRRERLDQTRNWSRRPAVERFVRSDQFGICHRATARRLQGDVPPP